MFVTNCPEMFPKLGSKSVDRPFLEHDWNAVGRREEIEEVEGRELLEMSRFVVFISHVTSID